nr:MAG TPA: hypothetical protein [Caudoviricetes sp.]
MGVRESILPPPFNVGFFPVKKITTCNHLSCLAWLAKRRGFI